MNLILSNTTLPMTIEETVVHKEIIIRYVGPYAETLQGTLTELDDTMIPEGITVLRDYTFQNNENLTSVSLQHVTDVGVSCFNSCAITDLYMPVLETAHMQSFAYNPFTSVIFPSLTSISTQMFQRCEQMTRADFPSVTEMMSRAFYICSSLDTLILRANQVVELSGTQHFYQTKIESGQGYIYVPDNLVDSYKTAEGWSTYANQIRSIDELEG